MVNVPPLKYKVYTSFKKTLNNKFLLFHNKYIDSYKNQLPLGI